MNTKYRLRRIWYRIKYQCEKPNNNMWHMYGKLGIKVCQQWINSFDSFQKWSLANGYQPDFYLQRINEDGNFTPSNCKWNKAFHPVRRNFVRLTAFGESKSLLKWWKDDRCKAPLAVIQSRLQDGMDFEEAMTTPSEKSFLITAFGETKSYSKWIKDVRCKVKPSTLWMRIRDGIDPELALSSKRFVIPRDNQMTENITAFGETKSLLEWVKDSRCKVTYSTLWGRRCRGYKLEDSLRRRIPKTAVSMTHPPPDTITAFGITKTFSKWEQDKRCVISCSTLKNRIRCGIDPEIAITQRVVKYGIPSQSIPIE